MSDYAQLYVRQSEQAQLSPKQPDQPSLYLLSAYSIPLFWLALFTPTDIVSSRVHPDEDYEWPHLVSPLAVSLERLLERQAGMSTTFGDFISPWLGQFHAALKLSAGRYVHLDTSQIGAVAFSGSAEGARAWRPQLELMLGDFGESLPVPRTGFMAKLFGEGLSDKWRALYYYGPGKLYEKERRRSVFAYCGSSGSDKLAPWEDAS